MAGCCPPGRGGRQGQAERVRTDGHHAGALIALPGGVFRMGTDDPDGFPDDREGPVREVTVAPFAIDAHCVSNARFAEFVSATGYRTDAERYGWSYVFARLLPGELRKISPRPQRTPWWCAVSGAYWEIPEGPGSDLEGRAEHPAVHISWNDASAYCVWAGRRLPTEAEWEYAARGGLDQARYPWGDELTPGGRHRCNIWQGRFPVHNTAEDGYIGTAPVDAYEPNGFGLYNVAGNVWEWCADRFEPGQVNIAMRGGSYLCHESYCNRYRVAARTKNTPDSSSGNVGFRVAADL
ncbi:formylglycine-generating enzyme family protein [Streptomyces collinus]|uniref:formylglycine-generating enzyme family protein n=1 Tax=Streptomyces collinus TaxID=42684 RepID=UPI0037F4FD30